MQDLSVPRISAALAVHMRLPVRLGAVLLLICAVTLIDPPAGRTSWLIEVVPGLAYVGILGAMYRRMPLSHFVYGGVYTYAETPLGNWARDAFGWERNHYDRVGHLALGVFPGFVIQEILLRRTPLTRGGWLTFLVLSVVLAIAAFWELVEWWVALLVAPGVGQAFLGTQGDVWDAHWDMLLALVGASVALLLLGGVHARSMDRVPTAPPMP